MAYKKFQAEQLFTGKQMSGASSVLITDEKGVVQEIIDEKDAGDDIQKFKGILSPGFVNCHCHLELSHMKGLIPEKTGLIDFVFKVITQRHFPEEEIFDAIENAEDEMFNNGIVAVGDICNNTLTFPQKNKQRISYYNFIEASGWLPEIAKARFERSLSYYEKFGQLLNVKFQPLTAIVPHAPYSVSEELWKLITPYFSNKSVSIHNQETSFEDELFIQGSGDFIRMYNMMKIDNSFFTPTGKSSLQTYFSKLVNAKNVILVHNTFTKQNDIDYAIKQSEINNQNVFWCLCANANLYIEDAMPPVQMFLDNDCKIVLGTDSLASNRSLNILDEIKTIQKKFPSVRMEILLKAATLNGAKALEMNNVSGSFEKGKQPGIILIENLKEENKISESSTSRRIL